MKHHIKQTGDTLVEVLIAMSVISVILGGGYAVAHQSLTAERRAQERGEGLQLVQTQVELLRTLSSFPTPAFCMTPSGVASAAFSGTPAYPDTSMPTYSVYPTGASGCVVNNVGHTTPAAGEEAALYHLSITPGSPIAGTFNVRAIWEQVGGGQEIVQVLYKLQ